MNKIKSIEIAKGISVLFIIFLNSINYWLNITEELQYIFAYIAIFCDIFGPILFVFTYSFETIFILQKMMGSPPEKEYRNSVISRGLIFIGLGFMYNLLIFFFSGFTIGIWGWNIIVYVGFAQIITYFSFKLIRWARLAIGILILLITGILRELLYFSKINNIFLEVLYFFIVSPDPSFSLLPYASLCFFASIFSELIYQAKTLDNKKAIRLSIKSTLKYGIIFLIAGFAVSLIDFYPLIDATVYNPLNYPFIDNNPILRNKSLLYIPFMPEFLLRGTVAHILFTVGLIIIIIGIIFYMNEISANNRRIFNIFRLYGKYSITIIFLQYVFLPLFLFQVNVILFFPILILFITLLGYLVYLWNKYANGRGSLEWIIEKSITSRSESN
jgi:hypothetical protein